MLKCNECNGKAGKHHIVFKGSKTIIIYMPINEVPLCKTCHQKLHNGKEMDIKYKMLLQSKLGKLFCNEYYDLSEIQIILKLSCFQLKSFVKGMSKQDGVYCSNEIIKCLMGGKLYV